MTTNEHQVENIEDMENRWREVATSSILAKEELMGCVGPC
jgi:hypothetical protein